MRRREQAALVLAGLALLAGCGSDDSSDEVDQAISELEEASGGPPDRLTKKPASAPALIRRYLELIDQDQFVEAWSYVDTDLQTEFGGFESWREGYATNTSTEVLEADVTSTAGEETDLTVRIRAVDSCEGERYESEFEGPWSVDETQSKITEAEFGRMAGESPPSDCS